MVLVFDLACNQRVEIQIVKNKKRENKMRLTKLRKENKKYKKFIV